MNPGPTVSAVAKTRLPRGRAIVQHVPRHVRTCLRVFLLSSYLTRSFPHALIVSSHLPTQSNWDGHCHVNNKPGCQGEAMTTHSCD